MKITTDHSASSHGVPVILDDDGSVMDYGPGVKTIRAMARMSTQQLADAIGVSRRTVEGWESGRMPSALALRAMAAIALCD